MTPVVKCYFAKTKTFSRNGSFAGKTSPKFERKSKLNINVKGFAAKKQEHILSKPDMLLFILSFMLYVKSSSKATVQGLSELFPSAITHSRNAQLMPRV